MNNLFIIISAEVSAKRFELPVNWGTLSEEDRKAFIKQCKKEAIREGVELHLHFN